VVQVRERDKNFTPASAEWTLGRARGLISERERRDRARLQHGRVAGVLFGVGGLAYLPAAVEVQGANDLGVLAVSAVAVCSGLLIWALPWQRMRPASLHVLVLVADLEISAAIWAADTATGAFFILLAVFAAYAFESREQIAVHVALFGMLLLLPVVYDPAESSDTVRLALLFWPIAALAAAMVTYLRERAELQERLVREFAAEAIDIAGRLLKSRSEDP
jgi:hypothetical protein